MTHKICFIEQEKKKIQAKGSEMKRTRRDRDEMEEIMFKLFERQPNWTLKQLIQETNQPEVYLLSFLLFLHLTVWLWIYFCQLEKLSSCSNISCPLLYLIHLQLLWCLFLVLFYVMDQVKFQNFPLLSLFWNMLLFNYDILCISHSVFWKQHL